MKMIILGMHWAPWWWYFFWGFWSNLNQDDHFWHAFCLMMVILFFGFLRRLNENDYFWHEICPKRWFIWDFVSDFCDFLCFFVDFKSFCFLFLKKYKESVSESWRWGGENVHGRWQFLRCFEVFLNIFDDNDHFWHGMTWNLFSHADTFFWVVISFWGFLSPIDENDHFCHRMCSMLMILFFLVLKPPEWRWSFLACIALHDDDTFFLGFEATSIKMIIFGMHFA